MSDIQVTVSLQTMIRLMLAAQACQNASVPAIQNPTPAAPTQAPTLPCGYVAFPEYGLAYKFFESMVPYDDAISRCALENGQLAVVDSYEKVEKLSSKFPNELWPWVGVHYLDDAKEWKTIDGKSISSVPWADGEPVMNAKCARLSSRYHGLANFPCSQRHTYLCEIVWPRT